MLQPQPIQPDELADVLGILLATPGRERVADDRRTRGFLDYLASSQVVWEGSRIGPPAAPTGLFLSLLLPGATAIVLVATPGELGIHLGDQHRLTVAALQRLQGRNLHFAQALLLPEAEGQHRLLKRVGFRALTPLIYMERDAKYPWVDSPNVDPSAWLNFSRQAYGEFAATLLETYEGSLDYPELTDLRPIDDIIAGHRASGRFNPSLWELLRIEGANAGCLLLTPLTHTQAAEVVYMGVPPAFRGRGIGSLLLRRALQRCREIGARRLTLAVDDRNTPAKRLYARFALHAVARRDAYLYRWPASRAGTR